MCVCVCVLVLFLVLCAEAVIKAARDPSPNVKAAAARAIGRLLLAQIAEGESCHQAARVRRGNREGRDGRVGSDQAEGKAASKLRLAALLLAEGNAGCCAGLATARPWPLCTPLCSHLGVPDCVPCCLCAFRPAAEGGAPQSLPPLLSSVVALLGMDQDSGGSWAEHV